MTPALTLRGLSIPRRTHPALEASPTVKRIALAAAIGLALLSSVVFAVDAIGTRAAEAAAQAEATPSEPSGVTRVLAVIAAIAFMAWRRRRD
jgi:hypothetical protein